MLAYSDIKPKTYILLDGDPYEVLTSHIFRKQQRKPVNQTKLRSIKTGKVIERVFHQPDMVEEALLEKKGVMYLFHKFSRQKKEEEYWFSRMDNPRERFTLPQELVGHAILYIKENTPIEALYLDEKIIGITIPIKVTLGVIEAPPGIRGDTAQGGTKQVTLETGATVNAPLFINERDTIVVNTETGEYVSRA